MAIRTYILNNKKYYEIYLNVHLPNKKRSQRRRRVDQNGELISSLRKAQNVEYELKREFEKQSEGITNYRFHEWHEECLRRMKVTHKKSTLQGYDGDLKKWLNPGWNKRELSEFSQNLVYELLFEEIGPKASAHRKKSLLKRLRRIFEMAVEEGLIPRNPTHGLKVKVPPAKQNVLSPGEASKLLLEAKRCEHKFYPIWAFALFTGLRSGEMYSIRLKDIDLEGGLIHVNKQFTSKDGLHETKGNRHRVVPISKDLRLLLLELVAKGGYRETLWKWANDSKEEKASFVWDDLLLPRIREWRTGEQAAVLRDFCRASGINEIKFHDLRASFITNMLSQGVPLTVVMKIVGHSKMSTTDEYNRLAGVDVKGSTEKLAYELPAESEGLSNVIPLISS